VSELVSFEPATGKELWRAPETNIDEAVAKAKDAWSGWAAKPLSKRIEIVRKFANVVNSKAEELSNLISQETGKPIWAARAEVDMVSETARTSVSAYAERTPQRRIGGSKTANNSVRHKPHGVLAVLTPHSSSALVPVQHIASALLAGNTIVFKPSEKSLAVGAYIVQCLTDAGLGKHILEFVVGDAEAGRKLVSNPLLAGVLFTGSASTGVALSKKFAGRPDKLLVLEMGGNNPIVMWDANDVHSAAALVVQSAFGVSGQNCFAARRLIVKDSMYDLVVPEIKRITDRLIVDAPFADPAPFMGPVIDGQTADALTESFLLLMTNGGRPIKHMVRGHDDLPFLTPGIIDVTNMAERPDIELFGPILQIVRVHDFDEAIAEANNTIYGLSASLIGGTPEEYNRFWGHCRAGLVNWNKPTNGFSANAPVGGIGLSGNNRPTAYYAADYCAYPVASSELEQPAARIGIGLDEDKFETAPEAEAAE